MLLGNLLKINNKKNRRLSIKGISFDTKKIKKNDIFLLLKVSKQLELNLLKKQYQKGHQLL